jgi:hypothetical protein
MKSKETGAKRWRRTQSPDDISATPRSNHARSEPLVFLRTNMSAIINLFIDFR